MFEYHYQLVVITVNICNTTHLHYYLLCLLQLALLKEAECHIKVTSRHHLGVTQSGGQRQLFLGYLPSKLSLGDGKIT